MLTAAPHGEVFSYQLLPGRFMPNPDPAMHNNEGFVACNTESNATHLLINLQLNCHVQKEEMGAFVIPPYDPHYPSVQPITAFQTLLFSVWHIIYHASMKSAVHDHTKVHRRTSLAVIPQELLKKRPVRVTASCLREIMVVLRDHVNNESAEWLDVEEIDLDRREEPLVQQTLNCCYASHRQYRAVQFRGRMHNE